MPAVVVSAMATGYDSAVIEIQLGLTCIFDIR
jgi:hypothetical protein